MDDYFMDTKIVEKLIDIEKKILESYQLLFVFTDIPTDKVIKEKERLKVLIKKENILLNKLPQSSYILTYIYNLVLQNKQNFFDDEKDMNIVLERFSSVFDDIIDLVSDIEDAEIFEDEDVEIDNSFRANNRISIRDNIILKYIVELENILIDTDENVHGLIKNAQYSEAFHYKNIGDFLFDNGFVIRNVTYREDKKMAKTLQLNNDEYLSLKNDELFNLTQDVFFTILSDVLKEDNRGVNSKTIYDLLKFKFFVNEMPTPLLITTEDLISENIRKVEDKEGLLAQLCSFVTNELETRMDIPRKSEDNPLRNPVSIETADAIIELIKLDEKILNLFDEIDFDDVNNVLQIKELASLVLNEKELVSRINLDYKNAEVIDELLTKDLGFFLSEADEEVQVRKCELISERIHDLLPFYQKLELSPIQSQVSHACISQNHIVSALKLYRKLILKTKNEERVSFLKSFYKDIFFVNFKLMDDYIYAEGNYKVIDRFSDNLSAQSIGLSDIEYSFDKDEQLYEYAKYLIDEVLSYEDAWEHDLEIWAAFEFKLSELSDIIRNISDEHFYELPYLVKDNAYNSSKSKRKILSIMKR